VRLLERENNVMAIETTTLEWPDILTIVIYFVVVMAVGLIATFKANRGSTAGFFLAGKSMTWLPIAGSIFATNMGAPTLVGVAGSGAATGFAPVMFEWHSTYMLVLLGWVFVPIYMASGTYTMPEYLKKRYGGKRLRIYYAIVQIVLTVLTGISTEVYAGSIFINQILGWDVYLSTVLLLAITAIYTIGGGLAAVIYTDALQSAILVIGTMVLSIMAMDRIGGYEAMIERYPKAASSEAYLKQTLYQNASCGFPPEDAFHIFRDMDSAYPWPGLTIGLTLLASYYFCTNQTIVQRNLSAKSVSHSKAACVMASYLKILPFFLFLWPGMISRILYPDEVGCSDPDICNEICDNQNGCSDIAFPLLVLRVLPSGVRGLMLAAMLAALMSSLTSIFNSISSVFTLDIWKNIRPHANEKETLIVGRVFGICLIAVSIAWLPILLLIRGSQLWDYLQSISAYITPPWVVVFFLGMFWSRATEQGAWYGLLAGLVVGICRMGIHFGYASPKCGSTDPDVRPSVFTEVHYLHFAILLAGITFIVDVGVSLVTKPRKKHQLHKVTWWTRMDYKEPELTEDEDADPEDEYIPPEDLSTMKNVYNKVCGFNKPPVPKLSAEEAAALRVKMTDIHEDPLWSRVCDINAIVAISVTCFIIGFYA